MVVVNFNLVLTDPAHAGSPIEQWMSLLEGRATATFVVLAGVGMTLGSKIRSGIPEPHVRHGIQIRLFTRGALLFVFGLLYTPIWPADILHFYGCYIALGTLLLYARARSLWIGIVVLVFGFVVLLGVFDYEAGWNFDTLEYADFWTPAGMARHIFFNGFHPVVPWAAFLLYGLWLGRQVLSQGRTRARLVAYGLLAWIGAEVVSKASVAEISKGITDANEMADLQTVLGTAPMPPVPLYVVAGMGAATVVIVGCVELAGRLHRGAVMTVLLSGGKLALTLYVAHVLVGMGIAEAFGLLYRLTPGVTLTYALVFCALSVVFAAAWLRRFKRGPLEGLLRKLSG